MKEATIILFFSVKFAMTFPVAVYGANMSFREVILFSNIGGLIGLFISLYLSHMIIWVWDTYVVSRLSLRKNKKRVFSHRNRFIVLIKSRYGFPGIVILSPLLLSIPLGAFLMTRYYGIKFRYISWMIAGQAGWSILYTIFYMYVKQQVLHW